MKRTAFFISDGTGITAETLGQSLLAQFENIQFSKLVRPYVDTPEKARSMVQQINQAAANDGYRPMLGAKPEALGQPMRVTWPASL